LLLCSCMVAYPFPSALTEAWLVDVQPKGYAAFILFPHLKMIPHLLHARLANRSLLKPIHLRNYLRRSGTQSAVTLRKGKVQRLFPSTMSVKKSSRYEPFP
jgi:hypothetical protein